VLHAWPRPCASSGATAVAEARRLYLGPARMVAAATMPARTRAAVMAAVALLAACSRGPALVTRPADARPPLVIRNVPALDAPGAVLADGTRDVIVRAGRIIAIAPPGVASGGLPELDGAGGTLLPGLVDVHVHSGSSAEPPGRFALPDIDANLAAFLYAGV